MLEGKIAVVTGAARGIGAAIATALGREKATVIINYNGSKDRAEAVAAQIKAEGGQAVCMQCDVAQFDACEAFIAKVIETYGKIDILVNNAGITRDGLLMKMSEKDFDDVIATNLKGAFNCSRFVMRPMLRAKSGRIINITSVSGILGNAGQVNYAASKAGVIGLTKSIAREVAKKGITANAVAPGFIETEMTEVLSEAQKEAAKEQIPLARFGKPEDIAAMVVFLASDKAGYITGQTIHVDGGMAI
ncbi:MAG: 3-oxoacyl-[acyl-carrier-protein] reductase [Lachnospiraceae bacterium]